jgi:DNA polymerase III sliding clamp (beta) subunit (PCNA family)
MPIDTNRLEQFKQTKLAYDKMPQVKEFIMPTRSFKEVAQYLDDNSLWKDVKLVKYSHKIGFNP